MSTLKKQFQKSPIYNKKSEKKRNNTNSNTKQTNQNYKNLQNTHMLNWSSKQEWALYSCHPQLTMHCNTQDTFVACMYSNTRNTIKAVCKYLSTNVRTPMVNTRLPPLHNHLRLEMMMITITCLLFFIRIYFFLLLLCCMCRLLRVYAT